MFRGIVSLPHKAIFHILGFVPLVSNGALSRTLPVNLYLKIPAVSYGIETLFYC